jgi:hypothetical protein
MEQKEMVGFLRIPVAAYSRLRKWRFAEENGKPFTDAPRSELLMKGFFNTTNIISRPVAELLGDPLDELHRDSLTCAAQKLMIQIAESMPRDLRVVGCDVAVA